MRKCLVLIFAGLFLTGCAAHLRQESTPEGEFLIDSMGAVSEKCDAGKLLTEQSSLSECKRTFKEYVEAINKLTARKDSCKMSYLQRQVIKEKAKKTVAASIVIFSYCLSDIGIKDNDCKETFIPFLEESKEGRKVIEKMR